MDAYKSYLKSNRSHHLKEESIRSYISYLRNVPRILKMDEDKFLNIDNPKKLDVLFELLVLSPKFKNENKKSQGNIKTAFLRYIESVKRLNDIAPIAREYLLELNAALKKIKTHSSNPKKVTKSIAVTLTHFLFERNEPPKHWDRSLFAYLKLRTPSQMNLIYKVSQNLLSGKYHEMVYNHFQVTAKVIAIKAHIKALKH